MVFPSVGSAASPTLAVSRPTSFVKVAGPSSLLWTPKLHLAFPLSSKKPEIFENSAYAQSLVLEALGDPHLGFSGLTLVWISKKCRNPGMWESTRQTLQIQLIKKEKESKGTSREVLMYILFRHHLFSLILELPVEQFCHSTPSTKAYHICVGWTCWYLYFVVFICLIS